MSNIFHDNMTLHSAMAVRRINEFLARGEPVVVATLVPVPRTPGQAIGCKALVDRSGALVGETEGGGLERKICGEAAHVWRSGVPRLIECTGLGSIEDKDAGITGSIERIFLERIEPDAENTRLFGVLRERLGNGLPSLLVSPLPAARAGDCAGAGRCLLGPEGVLAGGLPANATTGEALGPGWETRVPTGKLLGAMPCFLEPVLPLAPVYILGAGRVGRLVADLAARMAFRVVVMDDDPRYACTTRFPLADAAIVLKSFADCFAGQALGPDASVVIMTRGHAHDREVLAQALRTPAGYIGMMGCKADGLARVAQVGQTGFSPQDVAHVRCPIGLPIGGATPEETACSVVAELVLARTERLRAAAKGSNRD